MENKWSVVMMMFILVVFTAIEGEAVNHLCTFKCEMLCRDPEFTSDCFKKCMADCDHKNAFHSTSQSRTKATRMEEMRG
ncbi:hypothetical protein AALP_AA8G462700 [Arabis alpina]|uniref:Plant thionin family protein n=1 Tax=Arabis alpina TaxID=50452 RepID=A0A087GDS7_ARAAL|nr:hypothetical protein AALP_AA8G462700 [Arabis alpina]